MEVTCNTKDTLELSQLTDFQGNLKTRTAEDYDKIIKSINEHGFAVPFFVWKHDGINHVLDGHGRIGALNRMVAKGEEIPPLPVVYVNCKDEADAKKLLLKINSSYGTMTIDSVTGFIGEININLEDLSLPAGALDFSENIEEETEINNDTPINTNSDFSYEQQYGVIVMCKNETEQEQIYNNLSKQGFTCKVVAV